MSQITLTARGPFSLAASTRFLESFTPAAYESTDAGHLHLAFPLVPDGGTAGACITQTGGDDVVLELFGSADPDAARTQVERILSLHVDGSGWPEIGERDPVIGELQREHNGLRPVGFNSPYEAACWAVIGQRIRIVQAARIKADLATTLGERVSIHGREESAFPAAALLANAADVAGLPAPKADRLRGLARAALDGKLDAELLASLPEAEALAELQELSGIGPFSADLILLRGVNLPDGLPSHEPRLGRAVQRVYDLSEPPTAEAIEQRAEGWRPYRTWATVLLRTSLEETTGEIAGPRRRPA